jgi:hypothetical protein
LQFQFQFRTQTLDAYRVVGAYLVEHSFRVEEESFQAVEAWRRSSLVPYAVDTPYREEPPYQEEEEAVAVLPCPVAVLPFLVEAVPFLVEAHPYPVEAPYLEGIDLDQTFRQGSLMEQDYDGRMNNVYSDSRCRENYHRLSIDS